VFVPSCEPQFQLRSGNNTNFVEVRATNGRKKTAIDDATLSFVLKDESSTIIVPEIQMTFEANGVYFVNFSGISLTEGETYTGYVSGDTPGGLEVDLSFTYSTI
jgi:hypothetical protein